LLRKQKRNQKGVRKERLKEERSERKEKKRKKKNERKKERKQQRRKVSESCGRNAGKGWQASKLGRLKRLHGQFLEPENEGSPFENREIPGAEISWPQKCASKGCPLQIGNLQAGNPSYSPMLAPPPRFVAGTAPRGALVRTGGNYSRCGLN
jgi:hypothetical protein